MQPPVISQSMQTFFLLIFLPVKSFHSSDPYSQTHLSGHAVFPIVHNMHVHSEGGKSSVRSAYSGVPELQEKQFPLQNKDITLHRDADCTQENFQGGAVSFLVQMKSRH